MISEAGETLPNGAALPDRSTEPAASTGAGGSVRLVRNHEQSGATAFPTVPAAEASFVYDAGATGGTSTVVLDSENRKSDEYVSLAGTFNNCAGGVTPWGTWLTCEETETKAGGELHQDHGFVFEVDPGNAGNNMAPTPLVALGRFAHEAAAIDPSTGDVYLTEDTSNPNGLVYKCVPSDPTPSYGWLPRRWDLVRDAVLLQWDVRPGPVGVRNARHRVDRRVGDGSRSTCGCGVDAQAICVCRRSRWRTGDPQPQVRRRLVGRRARPHSVLVRASQRRLARGARRTGVESRPGIGHAHARGSRSRSTPIRAGRERACPMVRTTSPSRRGVG